MSNAADMPMLTYFRRVAILAVLERRDFRYLWAAYIVSHAGDGVYMFAISRFFFEEIGRQQDTTAAFIAVMIPILIMPPIAGVLADRLDRKSLMLFAHVARVPVLAALFVVGHVAGLGLLYVAVAGFAVTAAGRLFHPARAAMVPNLLARHKLVAGNAVLMSGEYAIGFAGFYVGGFLGVAIGGLNSFGVAAVAFSVAALLIYRMDSPQSAPRRPAIGPGMRRYARPIALVGVAIRDVAGAVYFILKHPLLRAIALVGVLYVALISSLITITVPELMRETLGAALRGIDFPDGMRDIWIFLALPAVPWLARRLGDGTMGVLAFAAMGILLGLLAVVGQSWQVFVIAALLGVLIAGMLPLRSLVQAETPDRLRGRVIGVLAALNTLASLGAVLILATSLDLLEVVPLYLACGLLVVVVGAFLFSLREVREARLTASEHE